MSERPVVGQRASRVLVLANTNPVSMNRLFGGGAKKPKATLDDALASNDTRVSSIDVKLSKTNAELSALQSRLQKMRDGPAKQALKQKALKVLKQRKMYEAQKDQLQAQAFNIEQAGMTTDGLKSVMVQVEAMKQASKQMKREYGKVNVDKIDKLQDEMADLLDASNELQEALGRNYNIPDDVSEGELDAELEALGDEVDFELEGEVPSYLKESEAPPEFIDEEPQKDKVAAG